MFTFVIVTMVAQGLESNPRLHVASLADSKNE